MKLLNGMLLLPFLFCGYSIASDTLVVKTQAPENQDAVFQYRVSKGYDTKRKEMYRVLVIFGGRNTDGKADASGHMGVGRVV